jgi:hypothetical protein
VNVKFVIGAAFRSSPETIVAVGEPVRQDDFLYTVARVGKHSENGNVAYLVTIRVDNQAEVVDYRWRDEIAYVTDAAGSQYHAEPGPVNDSERLAISAGESAAYTLAFVLPLTAKTPVLRYSNGILMGDVSDGAAYRRATTPL